MPLDAMTARPSGRVRVTDSKGVEHEVNSATKPLTHPEKKPGSRPAATQGSGATLGTTPGAGAVAETWRMSVAGFWIVDVTHEPTGDISILQEVELSESRRVEYDPPLPLLPATLTMDLPIEVVTQARVYDHDNNTLQSQGTCTTVYRLLGNKQITLPNRKVNAVIIQTDRLFDLPWVQVDIHILAAYVPGEGTVAWRTRRDIRILGVLPVSREERVVRVR